MHDRIEIRMFGRFFVRRSDGSVVEADEWSTGKTTDLLRLLALSANRPVSVHSILDKLWPDVDENKARASLRTAASRIRQVMGEACIERHLGGLILRNTWTDVVAFQTTVQDIAVAVRQGDPTRVVALAREAEALYTADFHAYDDKSFWAGETRDVLRMSRQSMLADAGEAALTLTWIRDAIDFSTMAIAEDPCFERPHRTLMQAHAALGEIEFALRAFEHLRVCLSQELGADPSPQSRALHLQMLSGGAVEIAPAPFTGRAREVAFLATQISAAIDGAGCDVVCLTGPAGSGREALLETAVGRVRHAHLRRLLEDTHSSLTLRNQARRVSDRSSDVTVWRPGGDEPAREVDTLLGLLADLDPTVPRVIAFLASDEAGDLLEQAAADGSLTVHRMSAGPLCDADMASLAATTLSGPPTAHLLRTLDEQSGRLAGQAVSILREWVASGWIILTSDGLDLYQDAHTLGGALPPGSYYRATLEQMTADEIELCQLLAVFDRPVSGETLRLLSDQFEHPRLEELWDKLDELADLGVLRVTPCGYEFRNRALLDSFAHRLRPAVRARMLRQIEQRLPGAALSGRDDGFRAMLVSWAPVAHSAAFSPES